MWVDGQPSARHAEGSCCYQRVDVDHGGVRTAAMRQEPQIATEISRRLRGEPPRTVEIARLDDRPPQQPGFYAWWVDAHTLPDVPVNEIRHSPHRRRVLGRILGASARIRMRKERRCRGHPPNGDTGVSLNDDFLLPITKSSEARPRAQSRQPQLREGAQMGAVEPAYRGNSACTSHHSRKGRDRFDRSLARRLLTRVLGPNLAV